MQNRIAGGLVALLVLGGCQPATPPHSPFAANLNLVAVVEKAAPKDFEWGLKDYDHNDSRGPGKATSEHTLVFELGGDGSHDEASIAEFVKAVIDELSAEVRAKGGEISGAVYTSNYGKDGRRFNYTLGHAIGRVFVAESDGLSADSEPAISVVVRESAVP